MLILEIACDLAKTELGVSCDLIDLRSIMPWDADMVEVRFLNVSFIYFLFLFLAKTSPLRIESDLRLVNGDLRC
jgi:hypothetical protein